MDVVVIYPPREFDFLFKISREQFFKQFTSFIIFVYYFSFLEWVLQYNPLKGI
jgi:hypothetical protein